MKQKLFLGFQTRFNRNQNTTEDDLRHEILGLGSRGIVLYPMWQKLENKGTDLCLPFSIYAKRRVSHDTTLIVSSADMKNDYCRNSDWFAVAVIIKTRVDD